ncbi:MAG: diacylglycerol kinase family lipid kinase [Clostridia bacterium]|nr:diacylglycerol kinase family lipid kinase [Clostridia bacterium]
MKHIFLINPAAGKGKSVDIIRPQIEEYCGKSGIDYEIYVTQRRNDALEYCRERAKSGESIRFYACGGDGTLYEVVNGVYGYPNCEVAVIPLGSGNDFIRLFGTKEQFINVEAQVTGVPVELDVVKCGDKIAINQCSMGLDAEVCAKQASFKKIPAMNGEVAYLAATFYSLLRKVGHKFTVTIDDNEPFTDTVLFCVAANSRWYGGGFQAAPLAWPDDGQLDFVIVRKDRSRARLLPLVNKYKNGEHVGMDITRYVKGSKMKVHCDTPSAVNVDGECEFVTDSEFEIVRKAIKFVVPQFSTFLKDREERIAKEKEAVEQ